MSEQKETQPAGERWCNRLATHFSATSAMARLIETSKAFFETPAAQYLALNKCVDELKAALSVCQDSARHNPVWFAANELWNKVIPERVGVLCPSCFIKRADKIIVNTGWQLIP